MFFGNGYRDRELLSLRTRIFIRIHHLVIVGFVAWIGYLFAAQNLF